VFLPIHEPTTENRQGRGVGSQYRPALGAYKIYGTDGLEGERTVRRTGRTDTSRLAYALTFSRNFSLTFSIFGWACIEQ